MNIRSAENLTNRSQNIARIVLGLFLLTAGITHLTISRQAFQAQVPDWVPVSKDLTVVLSGVVEISLGIFLAFWVRQRVFWGWLAAIFFVLIFPGNVAQYIHHSNSFGLNTDFKRGMRLIFQPVLVAWALWGTGAWQSARKKDRIKH